MKLRTIRDIVVFALIVTAVTVLAAVLLEAWLLDRPLRTGQWKPTVLIGTMAAFPAVLFVGYNLRQITRMTIELERMLHRDRLTDAATRDFFFTRLDAEPWAKGVSLMVDVDHFKAVNDTYGHLAGDEAIRRIAGLLRSECRADDILCRFGGEEFLIFLRDADASLGWLVAERMRLRVEAEGVALDGVQLSVTISVGVAEKTGNAGIEEAIRNADAALYEAKAQGRNRTVVAGTRRASVA